ncbi:hypothetical protein L1987_69636 [Smallanthus sonchifolius]|uniref:Uncharacterized protein n=1 Tax=Smallanthus sonchifolius TaxID=185202 RepID=A0ACB9B602_9ASTR|nr:hypothetical protein L1987_69636 [Smallanthus sonchifolius]
MKSAHVHKLDWEVLDLKIQNWLDAVKIAMKTLFNGERILCDHVFASSDSIRESCYTEITKEGASILFGFPENVAKNNLTEFETLLNKQPSKTAIHKSDATPNTPLSIKHHRIFLLSSFPRSNPNFSIHLRKCNHLQ